MFAFLCAIRIGELFNLTLGFYLLLWLWGIMMLMLSRYKPVLLTVLKWEFLSGLMNEWLLWLWHFPFLPPHFFFRWFRSSLQKKKEFINDSIRAKTLNAVNNFQFVLHTLPLRRRLLVDLFRFKTKCDIKLRATELFFSFAPWFKKKFWTKRKKENGRF